MTDSGCTLEIYMRSIDRRWAKEATAAGADLVVVSPYLTSQTAERILLTSKHERACPTVLTTFTTEVFATGASHLATIGRLLKGGCRVFHVDGLHAKILLAPQFASIGSQNLTQRGTRTKEASVAVVHARAIAEVRRGVERWRSLARPIDMEMVELMEREVIPLRKRMKMLQRDLSATDRRIGGVLQERAAQRAKVERRLREEKARRQEQEKLVLWSTVRDRSSGLRAEVKKAQHSLHMNVTVVHVPWEDLYGNSGAYDTMKLSNPRVDDMRHWTLDGRMVNLAKGEPILMVLEEIGRLSLVLVNKIQVTYFGYRGQFTQPLVAVNSQWYVGAHFPTRLEDLKTWNVKLILTRDAKALENGGVGDRLEALCYFDIGRLSVEPIEHIERIGNDPSLLAMEAEFRVGNARIIGQLRRYLLDAGRFGWRVWYRRAPDYFAGFGSRFQLRLHDLKGSVFLIARQIH